MTTNKLIQEFAVELTLEGPYISQLSGGAQFGLDALALRTPAGEYLIPATLVQGRLREAVEELSTVCNGAFDELHQLLGHASAEGGNQPDRKRLVFSIFKEHRARSGEDPTQSTDPVRESPITRIQLDALTGAVKEGALQVIETAHAYGSKIVFLGKVKILGYTKLSTEQLTQSLQTALRWIPAFGAFTQVGFGKLLDVKISPIQSAGTKSPSSSQRAPDLNQTNRLSLMMQFDEPVCVSKGSPNKNLFEGQDVLPGTVIKGAIASLMRLAAGDSSSTGFGSETSNLFPALVQNFESIRFCHSRFAPVSNPQHSQLPIPHCLAVAGDSLVDLSDIDQAILIKDNQGQFVSPAFNMDWKYQNYLAAEKACNIFNPSQEGFVRTELEIRTAIDRSTGASLDSQLFAYESKLLSREVCWATELDFSKISPVQGQKATLELNELLKLSDYKLPQIGKTKAIAKVQLGTHSMDKPPTPQALGDVVKIFLTTDALLLPPNEGSDVRANHDEYKLQAAKVWDALSQGSMELSHFFSTQHLEGGAYLYHRFQEAAYRPYWLTDAGSVFVLKIKPGCQTTALKHLQQWQSQGLPLPDWFTQGTVIQQASDLPYHPNHGYGHVLVNPSLLNEVPKPEKSQIMQINEVLQ